jgi:predicted enzyme related to lactoylglutathione lyase
MNRVVHFEIPVDDTGKALKFYEEVFGWKAKRWGDLEFWLVTTGDGRGTGINGAIMKKKDPQQPVACSIEVENIDEMIKLIPEKGGQIVVPKMPIPGVGWLAYFKDTDGNISGIMQNDTSAK